MANLSFTNDRLQVWRSLQIVGIRTAHKRFDRRLADGAAEEQLDNGVFRHRSNAGQDLDKLVVTSVGSSQVDVVHVSSECFFTLH